MKIFFMRNVPNNIPWSLKVFPVMPVTIFPRKPMKNSCFFLPVCHCGTPYSKSAIPCARPSTALWHASRRCTAEALSLRVFGVGTSASRFCMLSMSTNTLWNLSLGPATSSEQSLALPGMIWVRYVTHSLFYDMPS